MSQLEIKNLSVSIEEKVILKNVSLTFDCSRMHVLMGPNGSGKSSLAYTLMGHPSYQIIEGNILLNGEDITDAEPYERSRKGLFLSFQNPIEIPGLTVGKYLKYIKEISLGEKKTSLNVKEFISQTRSYLDELNLPRDFMNRYLNEGFSGGEKKRMEMLQLLTLKPIFSLLDEIDSGLDIDALKKVAYIIEQFHQQYKKGSLIITHQYRILENLSIDTVTVLRAGEVVAKGNKELAQKIEKNGYDEWLDEKSGGKNA